MENTQNIVENWRKNVENRKNLTFLRFSMYYFSISLHFLVGAHKYKTSIDKNNKKKIMIFLFVLCLFLSIDIFISLCSSLRDDRKRSKKHG